MTYPQSDLTGLAVDDVGMRLLRAAEHIRANGLWKDGGIGGPINAHCASNALRLFAGDDDLIAHERLAAYLGVESPIGIFRWNDAPERTAEQVIDALTAAALSHAAQG